MNSRPDFPPWLGSDVAPTEHTDLSIPSWALAKPLAYGTKSLRLRASFTLEISVQQKALCLWPDQLRTGSFLAPLHGLWVMDSQTGAWGESALIRSVCWAVCTLLLA